MCIKCNTENLPFYSGSESSNFESANKESLVSDIIKIYFKGINDLNNHHTNYFFGHDNIKFICSSYNSLYTYHSAFENTD